MKTLLLLRGGGDLASGVALRLHRAGYRLVITELARPLAVRRLVSFSEAVYEGWMSVEGVSAKLVQIEQMSSGLESSDIPVIVDPDANVLKLNCFSAVIDARLLKAAPQSLPNQVPIHIGLGPGFQAGVDCHVVIETQRGPALGRVYYSGRTLPDSGQPSGNPHRVLRAAIGGTLTTHTKIGEHVEEGQLIAEVINNPARSEIRSQIRGVLRGLLRDGMVVTRNLKLGDIDSRDDPSLCRLVSDKALAAGGAVLETLLSARQFPNI